MSHTLSRVHIQPSAVKGTDAYLNTYRDEWREVFIISAEIYAFGLIMYLILASGKEQYWANGWPPRNSNSSTYSDTFNKSIVEKSTAVRQSVQAAAPIEKTKLVEQPLGVDYGSV